MALSFVASSAWVSSATSVTPTVPTGTTAGDYVVIGLVSKYEDASLGGAPAGWDDLGTAINATRTTGVDNGGMRGRLFGRLWQAGDTMPALAPTPNNVSTTHATTYRVAAGQAFEVEAAGCVDDVAGSPLLLSAGTTLGVTAGDLLHVEAVLNGDAPTFGTGTLTAAGATFSAVATNTADLATVTGTDMRMRSVRYTVSAGTATAAPSLSTALAGTTTTAVGVGFLLRLREVAPTVTSGTGSPLLGTLTGSGSGTVAAAPVTGATFVQDSGTDTDGTLLQNHTPQVGGPWVKTADESGPDALINTNRIVGNSSTAVTEYYLSGQAATDEFDLEAKFVRLGTPASGLLPALTFRRDTAGLTYYLLWWSPGSSPPMWEWYKRVAGGYAFLGSSSSQPLDATNPTRTVKIVCRNALKEFFVDGVSIGSTTDNAVTGFRRVGTRLYNGTATNGFALDDLLAADPAGTGGISGSGSPFLGAMSATAAGKVDIAGQGSKTLAALASVSTGKVDIAGSGAKTLASPTATGVGKVAVSGSLTRTLAVVTGTGTGTVASAPIAGAGSPLLGSLSSTGAGKVEVRGAGSGVVAALTVSGVGKAEARGSGAGSLGGLSASSAGKVEVKGSGGGLLGSVTSTSTGQVAVRGSGTSTLATASLSGTGAIGSVPISGSGTSTLAVLASIGTAKVEARGSGAAGFATLTGSGAARAEVRGTGAAGLAAFTGSGAGAVAVSGLGSSGLATLTGSGSVSVSVAGSGAPSLGSVWSVGAGVVAFTSIGPPPAVRLPSTATAGAHASSVAIVSRTAAVAIVSRTAAVAIVSRTATAEIPDRVTEVTVTYG